MKLAFDPKLSEELLEHPAIYYLLSWIQLVYEDEQRFEERVQQKIFTENDLFEEGKPALDRPLKFHKDTLPRMLHLLQKAQQILSVKKHITLEDFFQKLSPVCAQYYQQIAKQFPDDIFEAYHQLNHGPTVEQLCADNSPNKLYKQSVHKDEAEIKTLTCKEAIAALISNYSDGEKLDKQFKLLEYIGHYFPFIKELKLDAKQINTLLISLPEFRLPNALELLLRCGGNVNCCNENNETLLFRILAREDFGTHHHSERLARILLTHSAIDVHAAGQNGDTPLIAFIRNAKQYSLDFVKYVLALFVAKHTDLNQMTPSGTVLDIAVQLQSKELFIILVNHGCNNLKDAKLAVHFTSQSQDDTQIAATIKTLAALNPNFHFERALKLISSEMPDKDHSLALEGENHQTRYLDTRIAQQLFDKNGEFLADKAEHLGNFDYIKITLNDETLFYVAGYPSFPGIDVAASKFHRLFDSCTAPDSEVFKFTKKSGTPIALLFCGTGNGYSLTSVLQNAELKKTIFANLDLHNLTQFLFIQFAMGQITGATDNIQVLPYHFQGQTRYVVRYILNDKAFSPIEDEINPQEFFEYLQPLLALRLNPQAIEEFLKKNIRELVKDWLGKLFIHEARMSDLFSASHNNITLTKVPFEPGTIKKLFVRISGLREILEKNANPQFTGRDLLRCARSLYIRQSTPSNLIEHVSPRRNTQISPAEPVSPRRGTQTTPPEPVVARRGTQTTPPTPVSPRRAPLISSLLKQRTTSISETNTKRFTQKYFADPNMQKNYSVTAAIDELGQIDNNDAMLKKTIDELKGGKFNTFNELCFNVDRQTAVNSIIWKHVGKDTTLAKSILTTIVNANIEFSELLLTNCTVITDADLESLLRNSPNLRILNLAGSDTLPENLFKLLAKYCFNIEVINLDRTFVMQFTVDDLPNLKTISAAYCPKLSEVNIHTANLIELILESSAINQLNITVKSPFLTKLNVNNCENLNPACLTTLLPYTPALRDLQHIKVQAFDMRRYTASILQEKTITPTMAKSLVHDGMLNLSGLTIQEEQLHHIIEALTKAFLHKTQNINTVILTGCQNISRKAVAMLIEKLPHLDKVICQFSLEPAEQQRQISIKGNGHAISKILRLMTGLIVIFYDNASFEVWDADAEQSLRKGNLDKKISDADLMPNGDIIFCSDGKAKILDTITWKQGESIQLEAHQGNSHNFVKVIDNKWLVLGGANLTIMTITPDGFQHFKTTPNIHVKQMLCTPNQKIFVAQTEKYGSYIWKIDADTTVFFGKEYSSQVSGVRILDNNHVILPNIKSQEDIVLTLQPKFTIKKTFHFKALLEHDQLKKHYRLNGSTITADPCITCQGDVILNLGKTAVFAKNKPTSLLVSFKTSLPVSLTVTVLHNEKYAHHLKITHANNITEVEGLALRLFYEFIECFFPTDKFRVIKEQTAITICDIPPEDICSYQKMFESFVAKAIEYQKTFEGKANRSPRSQGTNAPKLFSYKSSEDMQPGAQLKSPRFSKPSYENLTTLKETSDHLNPKTTEHLMYNRFLKIFVNHGFSGNEDEVTIQDEFSGKTLMQLFNPEENTAINMTKASPPPMWRKNSFSSVDESNEDDESDKSFHSGITTPNESDDEGSVTTAGESKAKQLFRKIKARVRKKRDAKPTEPKSNLTLFSHKRTENASDRSTGETRPTPALPKPWEEQLDISTLDELTIMMMLISPTQDGPENYRVKRNTLERITTASIFVKPTVNGQLQCQSILFCLDSMRATVHKKAIAKIAKLNFTHIKAWLDICKAYSVNIREGIVEELWRKLALIQKTLEANPEITKLELLGVIDIHMLRHYNLAFEHSDPLTRYQSLPNPTLAEENCGTIEISIASLNTISKEWQMIPRIREELAEGITKGFAQLQSLVCQEEVINGFDFKNKICRYIPAFKPERLNLAYCTISIKDLMQFLKENGANLRYLNLSSCPEVTDVIFETLANYCPRLEQLFLANTNIKALNAALPVIELDLSGTDISDAIFAQIKHYCIDLRKLKLSQTSITQCNFQIHVEHLDISGCEIDNSFFNQLSEHAHQLKSLTLLSSKITRIDLRELKFLTVLDPSGCNNLQRIHAHKDNHKLKILRANRCKKLESIVFDDAKHLIALYANNSALIEISLSSGQILPALRILEIDNNFSLKALKVNPTKLCCFKALNCHNIESALNNALSRRLIEDVISSKSNAPAERPSSAMTVYLRGQEDAIKWAEREFGPDVFKGIVVPYLDATYANLAGGSLQDADLSNAILAGAKLANMNCSGVKFAGVDLGQLPMLLEHQSGVHLMTHSSDGHFFVSADMSGTVILRNRANILHTFHCKQSIVAIALLPIKLQLLVIGKHNSQIFDINPASHTCYQALKLDYFHAAQTVTAIAVTANENHIITAHSDGKMIIFDITKMGVYKPLIDNTLPFHVLAINKNNLLLAAGDNKGNIQIWNLNNHKMIQSIQAHSSKINALTFSADGKFLVSSSTEDKCVKIWNVCSFYRCDRKIDTNNEPVNCIAVSPDNQFVLAGTTSTLYVWNIKSGELVRLYGHEAIIDAIDIDPIPYKEKTWIIRSACTDGIIRRFIFHDNGIRYQLKREDFSTVFQANTMEISRSTGLSENNCLFLRQSGARGEPSASTILAQDDARTEDKLTL